MGLEPWEALDLDDSDLPSLLRPCKRQRSISTAPPSPPPLPNHPAQPEQPPSASSSRRLAIPGPAGAVQAAMLRKDLDRENRNFSGHGKGDDGLPSTQDYIRKAMDDTAEFDDDFSTHSWLSALQFLGNCGVVDVNLKLLSNSCYCL